MPTIKHLLFDSNLHVLIFYIFLGSSGDQDSVIPLTGSRRLVQRLANELGMNTTVPYRVWFEGQQVNKLKHRNLAFVSFDIILTIVLIKFLVQVGGWTQVYGDMLCFATVRGASHEAPFSQPARSLELFRAFLAGRPLPETF